MTAHTSTRGESAIRSAFEMAKARRRTALITYLTLGYPSPSESAELVTALQAGGADIIELGVPFSDPLADGPSIQRASHVSLLAGTTPRDCFDLVREARAAGVSVPLVLMGYYNPIHAYGIAAYVRDSVGAGVDGLIVPDLPPEEAGPLRCACESAGLALVFMVAPTSSAERIAIIAEATRGFVYVVSRLGTTGAGTGPAEELSARLKLVRRYARTPVAVGFGISRPEQVRALAPCVDGIIVGSAVVEHASAGRRALEEYVSSLSAELAR